MLEHASLPLLRVLGPEVAAVFADLHRAHGVDLPVSVPRSVASGRPAASWSASSWTTALWWTPIWPWSGSASRRTPSSPKLPGSIVENGIRVDEHLRTSDPDIYAAGDVANAYHPILHRPPACRAL